MSQHKTSLKNRKGFTIIEVLIAAGLLAIISLGVATMLENMAIEQKRVILFATLRDLKTRIEFQLKDQNSWTNTVNSSDSDTYNAGWACLRNTAVCTATGPLIAPWKFVVKDATNATVYDLLTWTGVGSTAGNGFRETGVPCTTFNNAAGSGDDNCPISYRLVYIFSCTGGAANCRDPQLRITGRLLYNPSDTGILNRFRGLIALGKMTADRSGADDDTDNAKYDISVLRTAAQLNRSFNLQMVISGGPGCAAGGAGRCYQCNTANCVDDMAALHPLSFTVINDPFNMLVSPLPDAGKSVQFNEVGYYSCSISTTAFATLGFTTALMEYDATGTTVISEVAQGSTVAGYWSGSAATIETKFNVSDITHRYKIHQRCDDNTTQGIVTAQNCTLGMNVSPYTAGVSTNIVSMSCYRIDQTF